jgi:L-arabinose isomerase
MLRNGKNFTIEAGHWKESDVLDRIVRHIKAAGIAAAMKSARVGAIGKPFAGMGDFAVPEEVLEASIGIKTIPFNAADAVRFVKGISVADIEVELAADMAGFDVSMGRAEDDKSQYINDETHRNTAVTCLAIRRWLEENKLSAFTANFLAVDKALGLPCMPFLEAGKAMARGIGYAGEGDVLTAALVGALASVFPETSFTEMFCPDWKNDSIFLSHMGEMNIALAAGKPRLAEIDYPFTDAENPLAAFGRFKAGRAVFVNLAPGRDNTFSLILAPVEMLDVQTDEDFKNCVRGWFRPNMPVSDFLAAYSRVGGTHHAALVYGDTADIIAGFGRMMGWKVVVLD